MLKFEELDKQVQVVLLLVNNPNFKVEKPYNLNMCGIKMKEWIIKSIKYAPIKEIEIDETDDLISVLKNVDLGNQKYTLVLFSDTPLLKRKTILEIIEYVSIKKLSVLKLTRGYVFETEYLKTIDKLYAPQLHYFDEEDFITCFNFKQFSLINDILQTRIINFHMKNGVLFYNPSSCNIDVDVVIEKGVKVYANNVLKGKCIIETNSQLLEGNKIENSIIKNDCVIENSHINKSFIEENCVIKPNCVIENNSLIQNNAIINSFSFIKNSVVKSNSNIEAFSKLEN